MQPCGKRVWFLQCTYEYCLIDWLNSSHIISWSQWSSPWSHKCSGDAQIVIVHTTTKNTLKLNTTHTRISIRPRHHVHSCPFPVQLKITTEISRYIQRNTHNNRGNKQQLLPGVLSEWRPASNQCKKQQQGKSKRSKNSIKTPLLPQWTTAYQMVTNYAENKNWTIFRLYCSNISLKIGFQNLLIFWNSVKNPSASTSVS